MIKKSIKKGLLFIFTISVLLGMTWTQSTADMEAITPIQIARPQGTQMMQMHKALLWLVANMQSANFTPDNVYYGVYNSVGSYSYPVIGVRERNITLDLRPLIYGLNTTIARLENDVKTDPTVLTYLNTLRAELLVHQSINIYDKIDSNILVEAVHDRKAVTIFYDKDTSVIQGIAKIKNNESISTQLFTGDEILSNIYLSLVRDKVSGSLEVINQWQFEDGSDASLLKGFIKRLTSNKWLTQELKFLFNIRGINVLQSLLAPDYALFNYPLVNPRVIERNSFEISQLRIDELTLQKVGSNLLVQEYDYKYIEHHLVGTLVYNDTNNNGMMDIGVQNATIGPYNVAYPTIGDEAKFRFDMKDIGERIYSRPVTTNNILEFGSNYTDVKGILQPLSANQDLSLLNQSSELHTIDEVSTLFHFSVNNDEGSISLKFDYVIGEWDSASELQGLGLNQLMASTVVDAKKERFFQWRVENDSIISDENANATKVSRFRFVDSEELFGEIRLDDIPYFWDVSQIEVNAVGQLIPMNLIELTYGHISSQADMIRVFRGTTDRKTFLYSVSYPKWDGLRIVHDPAYVVTGGEGATSDGTGIIPGFEFTTIFFAIPTFIIIDIYRRKRR
ncbi:hypothetical protein [Candidatus Hodarchaeum mangrovi]